MTWTDLGEMAQGSAMVTILPDDSDAGGLQTTLSGTLPCKKQRQIVNHSICRVLILEVGSYGEWCKSVVLKL